MLPKVSIVCRTYNHEAIIGETIDSVLAQTFQDWELIVSDDCSKDATVEKVKSYNDKRIRLLTSEKNIGIIANLNKVISACKGEYISILDGDDVYYPEKIAKQVKFLDENPDYGAVFSYIDFINDGKFRDVLDKMINVPAGSREQMIRKIFLKNNYMAFPTEMFRKEFAIDFPENMIAMADCRFHIKMLLKTKIKVLEEPLVKYRLSGDAQTSNWASPLSNQVEQIFLNDCFLEIKDVEFFKEIFTGLYEKYGEPTEKSIPYFIARMAIDNKQLSFWGLYTLSRLFVDKSYFDYICNEYNLSYRDYINIKKGRENEEIIQKTKLGSITIFKKKIKKDKYVKYYIFGSILIFKHKLKSK